MERQDKVTMILVAPITTTAMGGWGQEKNFQQPGGSLGIFF